MKLTFFCVASTLFFTVDSLPARAAEDEASPNGQVAHQLLLNAQQLANGLVARRVLVTDSGLKIDHRNQTRSASESLAEARVTTDVIDLGGVDLGSGALLPGPIEVREIRVSVGSNATGDDRVRVELRSGSSYFPKSTTWSDWGEPQQTAVGRYVQLRIEARSARDEFRILDAKIDFERVEQNAFRTAVMVVDSQVQQMVSSTIPFGYQRPDHVDLQWLRETFDLDSIIEGHKSEFDKVNALCTWVASRKNDRHDEWNTLPYYPWNVRRLMDEREGGTIYGHCASYCAVFIACCESLGWQGRHFAIEGYKRNSHETAEIYINEVGRWIYFDPSLATYFVDRKTGKPLDTLQMHDIYLATHYNQPGDTIPKIEMDYDLLARRREAIDWNTFPGVPVSEDWTYGEKKGPWHWQRAQGLMTTAWLQMTPRSNFYDQKEPAFRKFGWGPEGSNGYPVWVDERTPPRTSRTHNIFTRRRDFYWTLNQASLRLVRTAADRVAVELGNNQPFFERYRMRVDGNVSYQDASQFVWNLKPGENRLVVNCEDEFGRRGRSSRIILRLDPENSQP